MPIFLALQILFDKLYGSGKKSNLLKKELVMNRTQLVLGMLFSGVLYSCSSVHAGDENKAVLEILSQLDTDIFFNHSTDKYAAPYATATVASASQDPITVEKEAFATLYDNAFQRSESQVYTQGLIITSGISYTWLATNSSSLQEETKKYFDGRLKIWEHATAVHKHVVSMSALTVEPTSVVKISEADLMLLLQWSYGIKRADDVTEVLLDASGEKKITATPLLLQLINKYKAQEQN